MRVILSGYDGDTAVSYGLGSLAELARSLRWKRLLEEVNGLANQWRWPRRRVLKQFVFKLLLPPFALKSWRRLHRRQPPSPFAFEPMLRPDFARRVNLFERARDLIGDEYSSFHSDRYNHRQSLLSGMVLSGSELMGKLGAAWNLEARLPFFDRRFLEFAVSLPAGQKLHAGWSRYAMRRSMEGLLPKDVQWRAGKGNLSANVRRGLAENRELLDEIILRGGQVMEGFVDLPALHAAYRRFRDDPMRSTDADIFAILVCYTLAQWMMRNRLSA